MRRAVVPMIRVPDVAAAVEWYRAIGFDVVDSWAEAPEDGGEVTWAELRFGAGSVMFTMGGERSDAARRDVDLYVYVDDVADVARRLVGKADVLADVNDTFYGMREVAVRDLNGFWLTFGQQLPEATVR